MSYSITVSPNGRVILPAPLRKKLGIGSGGALLVEETPHGVVLRTQEQAWEHAQAIAAKAGGASSDDFLARRRRDSGE